MRDSVSRSAQGTFWKKFLGNLQKLLKTIGLTNVFMNLSPTARTRSVRESTVRITSGLLVLLKVKFTTAPRLVATAVAARVLPFGHTHYATL